MISPIFRTGILLGIFSLARIGSGSGHLSELPINRSFFYPLDDRHYRVIERRVAAGAPLDWITNRPIHFDNDSITLDRKWPESIRFGNWKRRDWDLFSYQKRDGTTFTITPRFSFRIDAGEHKAIIRRGSGIQFHGTLKNYLGYYFRFVDTTERGNGPYVKRGQLLEDRYGYVGPLMGGDETYYDATEAYLNWGWDWIDVTFGKDKVSWGPGRKTNLLLSDNAPSFDQLRIKARVTNSSQFTYLIGKLHPTAGMTGELLYRTIDGWPRISLEDKWIAAHRLEYTPRDWLLLSVSEAVIWGERGLDPSYLNPLYFLYSAQHDGGDRDNVSMSGDFLARLPGYTLLYGALLIDDMKVSKLGTGDAGNKLGFLGGVFKADMMDDRLDMRIEYIRLEPFVYSHFFPINRHANWNSTLGADLPPNSDRLETEIRYRPTFDLTISVSGALNRHGSLGGEITESIKPGASSKVFFLDGNRRYWNSGELIVEWEAIPGGVIEIGAVGGDRRSMLPDRYYFSIGYKI